MKVAEGRQFQLFPRSVPTRSISKKRESIDFLSNGHKDKAKVGLHTHESHYRGEAREYDWFVEPSANSPESTLAMAVLHRAILDLITPGTPMKYRRSAADWVAGTYGRKYEREYALSFTRISEHLTPMGVEEFRRLIFTFAEEAQENDKRADPFRFQRR